MKAILVPGTFANTGRNAPRDEWWKPGSSFWIAAARHGIDCFSFAWNTALDGVIGPNTDWLKAGGRLYEQANDLQPLTILAHSHGGNVAIYAAANHGLKIRRLITLATPVRSDMPYRAARANIGHWSHIYGGVRDWVQIAGELAVGRFQVLRRRMPLADDNTELPECDHSEIHDVAAWNKHSLWLGVTHG